MLQEGHGMDLQAFLCAACVTRYHKVFSLIDLTFWWLPLLKSTVPSSQQLQSDLQALAVQLLQRHSPAQRANRQRTVGLQSRWELLRKPLQEFPGRLLLLLSHPADTGCV